jgi:hypothetical protein
VAATLFRGIEKGVADLKPAGVFANPGARASFWQVTSGALEPDAIKPFLGAGDSVMIILLCKYAVDIQGFSASPGETECILLPGAQFEVVSAKRISKAGEPERTHVTLVEREGSFGANLQ